MFNDNKYELKTKNYERSTGTSISFVHLATNSITHANEIISDKKCIL